MVRCTHLVSVGLAASVGLLGCSGSGPVPVNGIVTVEGVGPLADVNVTFVPTATKGRPANGKTDSEGRFQLTTFAPQDGVLPGEYKVVISVVNPPGPPWKQQDPPRTVPILPAYGNPQQTPLIQIIPPDGEIRLELRKG
jgi:hypothetical protein